jgi:hypothetical protein
LENSKLFNWLQLGGILGVIVGLVLVGVQIQQATELTRLQMENEWRVNSWQQKEFTMMGESPAQIVAKATDSPGSLTTEELLIFETYLNSYLEYWSTMKVFSDEGLVPEDRWREPFNWVEGPEEYSGMTYYFGNHVAQAWWDAVAESGGWRVDPEFFEAANKAIRRVDPNELVKWQDLIRLKLAQRVSDSANVGI